MLRHVFIDCAPHSDGVVLLTHAHSDSYSAVRAHTVWCSTETAWLLAPKGKLAPRPHSLLLEPGVSYCVVTAPTAPGRFTVARHRQRAGVETIFIPFATEHCVGSLGFWFPREGFLYVGDSRCSGKLLRDLSVLVQPRSVTHVVGDSLWAQHEFPALESSVQQLQDLMTHLLTRFDRVRVLCPHSGTLWAMAELKGVCWSVSSKTAWNKVDVLQLARHLAPKHCSQTQLSRVVVSSVVRCGGSCTPPPSNPVEYAKYITTSAASGNEATVLLSAAWFLVHKLEPDTVYYHSNTNTFRAFVAFHADKTETLALKKQFPQARFSSAATRAFTTKKRG